MHLLLAQPGETTDGAEAVDLGQDPADIVVVTAADTEIAALAEARADAIPDLTLRLASLLHLQHPMSVDLHLDRTALKSRLVVVRALGGKGYWSYGLEQFAARLGAAGVPFAALPGDDKPDEELRRLSTVPGEDYERLWAYLVEGGPENAANFLRHCRWMLRRGERAPSGPDAGEGADDGPPAAPAPLLRAGIYWPGAGVADLDAVRAQWTEGAPVAALVFYRALVQGAGLHPVNRLVRALLAEA